MLKLDIKATSDKGRMRTNNEDMILVNGTFLRDNTMHRHVEVNDKGKYIIAIADGMGGHNGGEVASEIVLKSLCYLFRRLAGNLNISSFNEVVYVWMDKINKRLEKKGNESVALYGMGTTLVGFIVYENKFFWINCGDSRIYRYHSGMLSQISNDHSLNNLMGVHEHSHVIVNCIGGGCKTSYIDLVEFTESVVDGDIFILCSDGLTDMLGDIEIERVLATGGASEELCAAAIMAGGYDNISVCVVKVKIE
jgi:PPM family protein phosphatase